MAWSLFCRENRISGNLALVLLAVSFDAMFSKREDVQDVITAVEIRFGRINTLHKPIEWLA
jgi:hypothetical protein